MTRQASHADADIASFTRSNPPPPYPGEGYDLTPTPQSVNRPRLPEERRNVNLHRLPDDATIVKFQTIVREDKEIIIGRIKVQTPAATGTAHAFILRRYDTDAVSLTTMFKVAFPASTDEEEKREMDWVRSSYDTTGTNGSRDCDTVRLAGQWVSRHLAIHLAPAYNLSELVMALCKAAPDPNVSYRKSQRSQAAADEIARTRPSLTPAAASSSTRPAPSMTANDVEVPTAKRRRATSAQGTDEQRRLTLEATTTVTAPIGSVVDVNAEIESAKQLVRDLKRELQLRSAAGNELEETGGADAENSTRGRKRSANSDGAAVSGGAPSGTKREIRTNKRVEEKNGVVETTKRVAFGAMLFGLGASAALLLPQLAAQYL
ncbi:hypothetical protein CcaverHIS002_0203060 [Cutaneotrichosporon cavernicola]|uniref:HTH APSES-type domain-containing protein n=1 Tax=Cutaneotrichosporon cavernicola TaxID=279322 RepID=A0AA48I0G4_9TREE|nr:uncharacterized protein CcaverHIS019_0203060 [Cutaneotrichosporon cavernicola]BEI81146.1 hypothetical protein CcaverHIS002_0203060 [Cutaneotrichosporon cavernicola]BEI88944.1 hypothetical protein CcaverHIS019_0203060 [Cutaneotrichosporon cavernicola]BEI96721.1 hypothetical protein CcaverHIS631_0203100 [Cutaneotrichosporon cavernicola]BEJ04493.1 hypothetical protein CcaverHIS641_0203100 [Cutaneotrichosporon cavernicola]